MSFPERQRRGLNTARGNAPGTRRKIDEGLKARLNRWRYLSGRTIESGFQPSTRQTTIPGALPRAVLRRAVGAEESPLCAKQTIHDRNG